jgi:hypothetical protein
MINSHALAPAYDSAGVLFIFNALAGLEYWKNQPLSQADLVAVAVEAEAAGYAVLAGDSGPACYNLSQLAQIFRHVGYDPYRFYAHFCEAVARWN